MIKLKKFASVLALTIAVSQVFAVVPAHAEEATTEVCMHQSCPSYTEDAEWMCSSCSDSTEYIYTPDGEGIYHYRTWICRNEECKAESSEADELPCNFWNGGVCMDCNQERQNSTCIHEKCDEEVNESATCDNCIGYGANTWVKVDDKTHNEVLVCEWCGSETEVLETGLSHENWKNGYCRCGYYVGRPSSSVSGNDMPKEESKKEEKPVVPQKPIEEVISEALAQATEETIRTEEAMPVTSFVSTEAINTLPAEVKETSATETVYNLSKITTTRGFISAVDKIVKAKTTTEAVTFYSSKAIAFNADSLTALTNANTEFVYMFNHNGHLYKVTIPAGAKVDLAGQTFAGPLYIGAQLGTSVLVK